MKISRQKKGTEFVLKRLPVLVLATMLSLFLLSVSARQSYAATPHVDVMSLNSAINPASVRVLNEAIATAQQDGAQALVITINTPGGDINSMKAMEIAELNSPVPIITYVAPSGAMAASAGTFVTLAGQVAAMAPGTTIGAASPVTGSGGDIGSTMKAKIEQMLVADLTNIQQRYIAMSRTRYRWLRRRKPIPTSRHIKMALSTFARQDLQTCWRRQTIRWSRCQPEW